MCYAFRVPRVHVLLNRHNRFGLLASWALATTATLKDNPGAYSLEFCDADVAGKFAGWTRALSSDCWVWHAFLWFPRKIPAFRLQCMGREISFFAQARPPAMRAIEEHGARLERFVGRLHPRAPHTVRHVRLLRRVMVAGQEADQVVWRSVDVTNAALH